MVTVRDFEKQLVKLGYNLELYGLSHFIKNIWPEFVTRMQLQPERALEIITIIASRTFSRFMLTYPNGFHNHPEDIIIHEKLGNLIIAEADTVDFESTLQRDVEFQDLHTYPESRLNGETKRGSFLLWLMTECYGLQ